MAVPTDFWDTHQGDVATHTPIVGSAIEFDVLSIDGAGGVTSTKGAEITASSHFVGTAGSGGSARARYAGDLKQTLSDVTLTCRFSKTQFSTLRPLVGLASRGALQITAVDATTLSNASCDIISAVPAGGSTKDSEQIIATVVVSPTGDVDWA
jgi:shikimate 5-dehydrogenase